MSTILVVDDDEHIRLLHSEELKEAGYNVTTAEGDYNPDYEDVSDGDALDLGFTREECMDKILSDPLLDIATSLDVSETPYRPESRDKASRKYIAEYLKKHHLLGITECSNCGKLNYEGDEHCSRCGISFKKH